MENAEICIALDPHWTKGYNVKARVLYELDCFSETMKCLTHLKNLPMTNSCFENEKQKKEFHRNVNKLYTRCNINHTYNTERELTPYDDYWSSFSIDHVELITNFNHKVRAYFDAHITYPDRNETEMYLKFFYFLCCRYIKSNKLNKHIGNDAIVQEMLLNRSKAFAEAMKENSMYKIKAYVQGIDKSEFDI